jgi:hypothetical protein
MMTKKRRMITKEEQEPKTRSESNEITTRWRFWCDFDQSQTIDCVQFKVTCEWLKVRRIHLSPIIESWSSVTVRARERERERESEREDDEERQRRRRRMSHLNEKANIFFLFLFYYDQWIQNAIESKGERLLSNSSSSLSDRFRSLDSVRGLQQSLADPLPIGLGALVKPANPFDEQFELPFVLRPEVPFCPDWRAAAAAASKCPVMLAMLQMLVPTADAAVGATLAAAGDPAELAFVPRLSGRTVRASKAEADDAGLAHIPLPNELFAFMVGGWAATNGSDEPIEVIGALGVTALAELAAEQMAAAAWFKLERLANPLKALNPFRPCSELRPPSPAANPLRPPRLLKAFRLFRLPKPASAFIGLRLDRPEWWWPRYRALMLLWCGEEVIGGWDPFESQPVTTGDAIDVVGWVAPEVLTLLALVGRPLQLAPNEPLPGLTADWFWVEVELPGRLLLPISIPAAAAAAAAAAMLAWFRLLCICNSCWFDWLSENGWCNDCAPAPWYVIGWDGSTELLSRSSMNRLWLRKVSAQLQLQEFGINQKNAYLISLFHDFVWRASKSWGRTRWLSG